MFEKTPEGFPQMFDVVAINVDRWYGMVVFKKNKGTIKILDIVEPME